MTRQGSRPDVGKILSGLKDFQRNTVDHVFRRLYTDKDQTRRFLVADEVGLGKTLVARGVIAKAIDHLWDRVERIDVVYICSNADIARQNINRLNVTDADDFALASRITLLPTQISDLKHNRLNFVSFTPGTSFDLKSSTGTADERVLLYWLLDRAWGVRGAGPLNVFQGQMSADNFRYRVNTFNHKGVDQSLAKAFVEALGRHIQVERERGQPDLRAEFETLCNVFTRSDRIVPYEDSRKRSAFIGRLRGLLASTCLRALEPDLIILDEFQRFKHLLEGEDEASILAQELFNYSDEHSSARVLLLSATPYKMYTLSHEEEDDHYRDFLSTLRFLQPDQVEAARFEKLIEAYRRGLLRLGNETSERLLTIKNELQTQLRRVMVRTERLAVSEDRDGMLTEVKQSDALLEPQDLDSYLALERIAELLDHDSPLEYWKSAPYLLNFMDEYELKRAFEKALADPEKHRDLARLLALYNSLLLPWPSHVTKYREVDAGNARLRSLLKETIGLGAWRFLWIPPSLSYYRLEGPFAEPALTKLTKRLIFSSWRVVPKVISLLLSYEAERRMIFSFEEEAVNTPEARANRPRLLLFALRENRLTGMPLFSLVYPCATLARECDPLMFLADGRYGADIPTVNELVAVISQRIEALIGQIELKRPSSGPVDERWYWAAPILLDLVFAKETTREWFAQDDLAVKWSGKEDTSDEDTETRWADHIEQVRELVHDFRAKNLSLGPRPADLTLVLAQIAIASPANTALRALSRVTGGRPALSNIEIRNSAAQIGWAFLSLFNLPETTALLRGLNREEPYWRRVVEYCLAGGLQSVLDEYVHMLRESLGLLDHSSEKVAAEISDTIREAITLRTSTSDVDEVVIPPSANTIEVKKGRGMRGRFALRFGNERVDGNNEPTRADQVRTAFNSPFWPFVLATTSVGQEGLDFHPYCHAVVHWNLPSNPVDLEQREGRVHRYKGHAVRKNLASHYRLEEIAALLNHDPDPWTVLFKLGQRDRGSETSDLVPFWIYSVAGGAKIERHVPALPLSRDSEWLIVLRQSLAVYRMVFGQYRQEDLLAYLLAHLPLSDLGQLTNDLRLDLSPPSVHV